MFARRPLALGLILLVALAGMRAEPALLYANDAPAAEKTKPRTNQDKKTKPKKVTSTEPEKTKPKKEVSKKQEKAKPEKEISKKQEKAKPEKGATKTKRPSLLSEILKKATAQGQKADAKPTEPPKTNAKANEKSQAKPEVKKPVKRINVVQLTLRGSYPEGPSMTGPFGEMEATLASLLKKFEQLAEDKNVTAVLLEVDEAEVGGGKVHEIRQAIFRLRKAGKPVYAMLHGAEGGQYLIACACDEIILSPPAMIAIPGVRAEVMFYKGLLDKLGVKADILRMGKYKGSAELYTRNGMSPELRESFEAVVNDNYEQLISMVAKDRRLKDYQVRTYIDQGLFTATDAKKAGLVDRVAYVDEFLVSLKKKRGADELLLVTKYKSQNRSAEFSGMSGMMKMMQVMLGGKPTAGESNNPKIAVIYAVGHIIQGKSESSLFGGSVLGSTTMIETLRLAEKDPTVKAIVFRVDSHGGSAVASDLIWHEIVRIKKPIIASMGDVAGSGGYYISVGADKIFAEPSTLTGSIGVIGGKVALGGLYKKLGLSVEIVSRGQNSRMFSNQNPFSPGERETVLTMMEEHYRQFVAKSAQGRKMSFEKLHSLAQGRIYTGNMAKNLGLVDQLGTLDDAVAEAKRAAGLAVGEKVEILVLPRPKSILEQLFGDPSAAADADGQLANLIRPLVQARVLARLFHEPALTLMPCLVELK